METATLAIEAAVEERHWWFVGRRRLLSRLMRSYRIPPHASVLDLGTGTGSNLRLLKRLGYERIVGVDANEEAIRFCAEKGLGMVQRADACHLPFEKDRFRMILATDILEHVEDDHRALSELARVLVPGGTAILTVPAFRSLWGLQDRVAHHKRRYRMRPLLHLIRASGLVCHERFYFNYLLFVPIWLGRQVIRIFRIPLASENQVNTPWLNRLLTWLFLLDVWSARWLHVPFGVSIAAVVVKPSASHVGAARHH